ncbi:protein of unknown function [Tepidibacter aestuarii]|nr:protein of unknown function [Tepidibacter aestuarii]
MYISVVTNIFAKDVGKTIVKNKVLNGAGRPTMKSAEIKNTLPLIIVAKNAIEAMLICFSLYLPISLIIK